MGYSEGTIKVGCFLPLQNDRNQNTIWSTPEALHVLQVYWFTLCRHRFDFASLYLSLRLVAAAAFMLLTALPQFAMTYKMSRRTYILPPGFI